QGSRRFSTSAVHRSHHEECPGKNIPRSTVFFGSGFPAPFLIVRHQPLNK
ncbi:hypothetical protein FD755_017517, partial [Muntiacus reevesi]